VYVKETPVYSSKNDSIYTTMVFMKRFSFFMVPVDRIKRLRTVPTKSNGFVVIPRMNDLYCGRFGIVVTSGYMITALE